MQIIQATKFANNIGKYNMDVQSETIQVTSHGHPVAYYISAREFEAIQEIRKSLRKSYTLDTLPYEDLKAMSEAKMDSRHDYLNALLEE